MDSIMYVFIRPKYNHYQRQRKPLNYWKLSAGRHIFIYYLHERRFLPDGRAFIGTGITPDLEVEVTVRDIIEQRDPILEAAIADILNQ